MNFSKDIMQELAYLEVSESLATDGKEYKLVQKEHVGSGRWSQQYSIVFEHDGKFYESYFTKGSTEYQDESPYEYDGEEIDCSEVFPVEVMTIEYRSKPATKAS